MFGSQGRQRTPTNWNKYWMVAQASCRTLETFVCN